MTGSHTHHQPSRRVGVAVVGLGGAVASTAAAGVELLRLGLAGHEGLPLAAEEDLISYDGLVFAGWDAHPGDLAAAAEHHGVLTPAQLAAAAPALSRIAPWPAIVDTDFCRNVEGVHRMAAERHRDRIDQVRRDLRRFREEEALDGLVMVNLASVERPIDPGEPALQSLGALESALDADDPAVGPALLYAYAALVEGVPYANFTPSVAAEVPALVELADDAGVPTAGKDGKTGQTMLKTLIAPGLRARALHVDGWFSTNILGNRDGEALHDPASLQSKLDTKASVLDSILGYPVEDHIVAIHYYRPRGDNKEAWDTIDVTGFLGQPMQIKVNFLARDSVLAAPLVLELARVLDRAQLAGERGVQEQLGAFFKAPATRDGETPEHALHVQEQVLRDWLAATRPAAATA
jgi:myo-inositol-1-phosphate synthase